MSQFLFRLGQRCARHPFRVVGVWLLIAAAVLGLNNQLGGEHQGQLHRSRRRGPARRTTSSRTEFPEFSGASGSDRVPRRGGHRRRSGRTSPRSSAALDQLARRSTDVTAVSDPFDARGPTVSADGTHRVRDGELLASTRSRRRTPRRPTRPPRSPATPASRPSSPAPWSIDEIQGSEAHRPRRRRDRAAGRVRLADRDGDPDRHRADRPRDRPRRRRDHGLLRRHPGDLDDDRLDDRPRRRHRLRPVRRHPPPPAPARGHVGRGRRRYRQRHRRPVGAVRRHDRGDRDHRPRRWPACRRSRRWASPRRSWCCSRWSIAVTLLPACLGLAGRHIDRWAIPHRKDRGGESAPDVRRPLGPPRRQAPVALRLAQPRRPAGDRRARCSSSRWASPTTPTPPSRAPSTRPTTCSPTASVQGFNGPFSIVVDLRLTSDDRRPWPSISDRGRGRPRHRRRAAGAAQRVRRHRRHHGAADDVAAGRRPPTRRSTGCARRRRPDGHRRHRRRRHGRRPHGDARPTSPNASPSGCRCSSSPWWRCRSSC